MDSTCSVLMNSHLGVHPAVTSCTYRNSKVMFLDIRSSLNWLPLLPVVEIQHSTKPLSLPDGGRLLPYATGGGLRRTLRQPMVIMPAMLPEGPGLVSSQRAQPENRKMSMKRVKERNAHLKALPESDKANEIVRVDVEQVARAEPAQVAEAGGGSSEHSCLWFIGQADSLEAVPGKARPHLCGCSGGCLCLIAGPS